MTNEEIDKVMERKKAGLYKMQIEEEDIPND